jgi:hypothetical protein
MGSMNIFAPAVSLPTVATLGVVEASVVPAENKRIPAITIVLSIANMVARSFGAFGFCGSL